MAISADRSERGDDAFIRTVCYLGRVYAHPSKRTQRAAFISLVGAFLSQHIDKFDTGKIEVAGPEASLVSAHLLRAL